MRAYNEYVYGACERRVGSLKALLETRLDDDVVVAGRIARVFHRAGTIHTPVGRDGTVGRVMKGHKAMPQLGAALRARDQQLGIAEVVENLA